MALTDRELMLLEQITYLDKSVYKAAGVKYKSIENYNGKSLRTVLSRFDEDSLEQLSKTDKIPTHLASGKEWAGLIRHLKKEPQILDLTLKDNYEIDVHENGKHRKEVVGLVFEDKKEPGSAVVAFKGTTGPQEWEDNGKGIYMSDTPSQQEALAFIEDLPYDNITVTGHSKGANKAMYVTLLSDKVKRCYCLDGQGFGKKFYEKYWAEVRAKGHLITNASLSQDYVHILLYPVPGSKQAYFKGQNIDGYMDNHTPNSFFKTDKDGNLIIKDGQITLKPEAESEAMKVLHGFSNYLMNNTTDQEQYEIGQVTAYILSNHFNKIKPSSKEWLQFANKNRKTLFLVLGALAKYCKANNIDEKARNKIIKNLNLEMIIPLADAYDFLAERFDKNPANLVGSFHRELFFNGLKNFIYFSHDVSVGIGEIFGAKHEQDLIDDFRAVDKRLSKFPNKGGAQEYQIRADKIYDFSISTYQTLMDVIATLENNAFPSLSSWQHYQTEEWYDSLLISVAKSGIEQYVDRLSDINRTSRQRIERVFNNVAEVDKRHAAKLDDTNLKLKQICDKINQLSSAIELKV